MNYYIQGNKDKASQIKAAFEKLGYNTSVNSWNFNGDCGVYFTNESDKTVDFTHIEVFVNLIKTHPDYKELELPVEPKFKVGDWIANDYCVGKVIAPTDDAYLLDSGQGIPFSCEHNAHLWTIQDAKDGDVLATDNGWTCIFKAFDGDVFSSYCFMDSQKWFCESGSEAHTLDSRINGNIHPATKEQRDLFFKRMQEVGYQWDENNKELRKIKPHYDISNFKAFDKVLVRDSDIDFWDVDLFARYLDEFQCFRGSWEQCIPFEGNEHLHWTTNMCDEQYINW